MPFSGSVRNPTKTFQHLRGGFSLLSVPLAIITYFEMAVGDNLQARMISEIAMKQKIKRKLTVHFTTFNF
jgi:hypothetical protein